MSSVFFLLLFSPLWVVDLVFLVEVGLGLVPAGRSPHAQLRPRIAILTPAHNEEGVIRGSIEAIRAVSPPGVRHLVIAHNCQDGTVEQAQAGGAEVVALDRPDQHGKGYALAFGRDILAADPPDVVIVIDADCTADAGAIERLAMRAAADEAVQACYLFRSRPSDAIVIQVSNFAILVKNLVRQRGGARLRAPAVMTGSGMAFLWSRFAGLNLATGTVVEDLTVGIELIESGIPPIFAEDARIWSAPSSVEGTRAQRARWESGFLTTGRNTALPLLIKGMRMGSWSRIWMGLHLLVPPLTLLLLLNMLVCATLALACEWNGPEAPLLWSSFLLGAMLLVVLVAWALMGRATMAAGTLLRIPFYVIWKLILYKRVVAREEKVAWTRTERVD